jgi:hypothetical protein
MKRKCCVCCKFLRDEMLVLATGGLWLIWILVREMNES